ncbi:MAG: triose-phosphate isomerase [Patescibacteria group bacterium]|nr:triose-phosphate isomerase [Patescibacteria group bacterium]
MKKLVVANWKCNPITLALAKKLFNSVKKGLKNIKKTTVVFCPPFVYLEELSKLKKELKLGAQNCCWQEKGAFTGEVSPKMLKDLGCEYVILGHSERRKYGCESNSLINKRIKSAIKQGLKPILCIDSISQIKPCLKGVSKQNVIIAYEPVWAIGTGKTPSFKQAMAFNNKVKKALDSKTIILYGGSVSAKNVKGFINQSGFDGVLLGGASLQVKEFASIVQAVENI